MIYTVEINGRGIAALGHKNVVEEEYFREDLLAFTSEGKPLWDGQSELFIRDAFPEEQEQWRKSQAIAVKEGELDNDEAEYWVCFLVSLDREDDDELSD
jgi:hypothetical protein